MQRRMVKVDPVSRAHLRRRHDPVPTAGERCTIPWRGRRPSPTSVHTREMGFWKEQEKNPTAYLFPAFDLCIGVDAWDVCISSCIMGDESGFGDEQAPRCGTALGIVGCLLRAGDMGVVRSEAGQWGEHDAVLKGYPADLDGLEERRRLLCRDHGWFELDKNTSE